MRVIAQRGERAFLIDVEDGRAFVVNIEAEPELSAPTSVDSALSRGYWEEFAFDEGLVIELANWIAGAGEPVAGGGWAEREPARRLLGVHVSPHDLAGVTVITTGIGENYIDRTSTQSVHARSLVSSVWRAPGRPRQPETAGSP